MTIYIVTSGSYSEYHICGVFDSAAGAREFIVRENLEPCGKIEHYEVNAMPACPPGLLAWLVVMGRDGTATKVERVAASGMQGNGQWRATARAEETEEIEFVMWAQDAGQAVKIANERRLQLLAADQWITHWDHWYARYKANTLLTF